MAHGGQGPAGMHFHVGAGVVFHGADRAPTAAHRAARLDDAGPQRFAGHRLSQEAGGAHKAVAVGRLPVGKVHAVDHAVAVERVVLAHGGVDLVVAIAQVHAIQVGRQFADHLQIGRAGRPLGVGGAVAAVEVGVVRGQAAQIDARMDFKHRILQVGGEGKEGGEAVSASAQTRWRWPPQRLRVMPPRHSAGREPPFRQADNSPAWRPWHPLGGPGQLSCR